MFVLFQLLDVAATDLLNKSSGSPATTPLHLVVSSFLCDHFIPALNNSLPLVSYTKACNACMCTESKIIKLLLKTPYHFIVNASGLTVRVKHPIICNTFCLLQAYHGHFPALQVLLESFIDIDIKDANGKQLESVLLMLYIFFPI